MSLCRIGQLQNDIFIDVGFSKIDSLYLSHWDWVSVRSFCGTMPVTNWSWGRLQLSACY